MSFTKRALTLLKKIFINDVDKYHAENTVLKKEK